MRFSPIHLTEVMPSSEVCLCDSGVTSVTRVLAYRAVDKARVQAYEAPIVRWPDGFRGGPVLEDEHDAPLRHTRAGKPVDSFTAGQTFDFVLKGEYVYSGPIYGNNILDSAPLQS